MLRGAAEIHRPQAVQPVEHLLVLGQGHVIQEGIAAVNQPRDTRSRDMLHDAVVLCEIDAAGRVATPGQRRHREHTAGIL